MTMTTLAPGLIERAVADALAEDLGLAGDITTNAVVPPGKMAQAVIATRQPGVIAGLDLARAAFALVDPRVTFVENVSDGEWVGATGVPIVTLTGPARSILIAERVALNFLGRLSGIATLTAAYCEQVKHTKAHIVDTRKTTPGLRAFEKYAVRCGGGHNHRVGLFDAILIKDNHIVAADGIDAAIAAARAYAGHLVKIEVEVDTLAQLDAVLGLEARVDAVLLDNMTLDQLREAVKRVAGTMLTEASGGVDLTTVRAIAETGVDLISVGALTHSAKVLDLGLDFSLD